MISRRAEALLRLAPLVLALTTLQANSWELSGEIGLEGRLFLQEGLREEAGYRANLSLMAEPELYRDWNNGKHSLTFTLFGRIDQRDANRTHLDIRELTWQYNERSWELRLGIRKVFWGVAESNHLADIINQTDFVENIDGEEKLGQPMVNFALIQDWGTLDVFILPGFRTRTFFSSDGRPGVPFPIDHRDATFDAENGRGHVDFAARWFNTFGPADIGLYHFRGTSRDPRFFPSDQLGPSDQAGRTIFRPHYDLINQTGMDLQITEGGWLWKLETTNRYGQGDRFLALVGGLEYTFGNIKASGIDLGVLAEYNFDERDEEALTLLEDDVFVGLRLAFNDVQDTQLLAGAAVDRESSASFVNVEASRRIGSRWTLDVQARLFVGVPPSDLFLFGIRNDDYAQATWSLHF